MRLVCRLLAAATALTFGTAANAEPFVLAILDYAYASDRSLLRPVFRETAKGWDSVWCDAKHCENFATAAQEHTWHLWLDGKQIGTLVSKDLRPDGALKVIFGKRGLGDGTFDNDREARAIALNTPVASMPSGWTEGAADAMPTHQQVWPLIRTAVPKVAICRNHDEGKPRQSRIGDVSERMIWGHESGAALVLYGVTDAGNDCDGPPSEQEEILVYRDKSGALTALPGQFACKNVSFYPGQFADFDGDGSDEALIAYEGDGCLGVTLYYDGFRKFVRMDKPYR